MFETEEEKERKLWHLRESFNRKCEEVAGYRTTFAKARELFAKGDMQGLADLLGSVK